MTIVRRILWRAVRLVAAATMLWAVAVALQRIGAWTEDLETMTDDARAVFEAVRIVSDRGPLLEEAWDAHDELLRRRPAAG